MSIVFIEIHLIGLHAVTSSSIQQDMLCISPFRPAFSQLIDADEALMILSWWKIFCNNLMRC